MNHLFCGIDIAKDTIAASLINADATPLSKPTTFKNNTQGFKAALRWMRKLAKPLKPFDIHVAMEATGIYYLACAKFFHDQTGVIVNVTNPAQIKSYAGAELVRTKTDGVDSLVIARFTSAVKPRPWSPPEPHEEEMLSLVRHMETIKDIVQAEKNRLHALEIVGDSTLPVQRAVKKHIRFLEKQIFELTGGLKKLLKEHPDVDEKIKLLCSIPGVGDVTACALVVDLGDVRRFDGVKQLVAHAGLAPAERQSGTSVRGRVMINKRGSKRLRKTLYMPAMVATRFNPVIRALYERLLAAGKKPMLALVACMRKLLHIAYGVLKNKKRFNPDWNSQKTA